MLKRYNCCNCTKHLKYLMSTLKRINTYILNPILFYNNNMLSVRRYEPPWNFKNIPTLYDLILYIRLLLAVVVHQIIYYVYYYYYTLFILSSLYQYYNL
jgi:hypothetical protein